MSSNITFDKMVEYTAKPFQSWDFDPNFALQIRTQQTATSALSYQAAAAPARPLTYQMPPSPRSEIIPVGISLEELEIDRKSLEKPLEVVSSDKSEAAPISAMKKEGSKARRVKQIPVRISLEELEKDIQSIKSTESAALTWAQLAKSGTASSATTPKTPRKTRSTPLTPQVVLPTEFKGEDVQNIRFSQWSISNIRTHGKETIAAFPHIAVPADAITLYDVIRVEGWDEKSSLLVVQMPDGKWTSFDNRRLAVARTIQHVSSSILVKALPHPHTEKAGQSFFLDRFGRVEEPLNTKLGYLTYGHAIQFRLSESSRINRQNFDSETYGFVEMPWICLSRDGGYPNHSIEFTENSYNFKRYN